MKYLQIFAVLFCFLFSGNTALAQNRELLDQSFAPTIESVFPASVFATAKQPDGKLLVGGLFTTANDRERYNLVRFNADGSLDDSFQASIYGYPPGVRAITILSDGKILIGGYFLDPLTQELRNIARLNSDGSFDRTFTGTTNTLVEIVVVQPDGKILIAGTFSNVNNQVRFRIARLNPNGTTDTTFSYAGTVIDGILLQPDGKIIISERVSSTTSTKTYKISRLEANGALDNSFAPVSASGIYFSRRSFKLQADGKILIGGNFAQINNSPRTSLARLNADGTVDETFNPILTQPVLGAPMVYAIETDANGQILIGGDFASVNGAPRNNAARLNADGSTDFSFINQTGANDVVYSIVSDANGKIYIGGDFRSYGGETHYRVARLDADGNPDTSFAPRINSNGIVYDIEIQPDGKILAAGSFYYVNGTAYGSIVRFLPDGTVDPTFAAYNQTQFGGDPITDIELQPDGKIIIVGGLYFRGNSTAFDVVRLNADGTIDTAFTPVDLRNTTIWVAKIQPNGQILVGGNAVSTARPLIRINSNGSIDNSFNPAFSSNTFPRVGEISVRDDGKILVGGYFSAVNGTSKENIALLNADGTLDNNFTTSASSDITSIEQASDGSFLIAGSFTSINGTPRNRIAKLKANGQLDTTFNFNSPLNYPVETIEPFDNGWIVLSGYYPNQIDVLNADGSLNVRLSSSRLSNRLILDLAVQNDGKILIGGDFTSVNNTTRYGLARLNGIESFARKSLFDYDGDGKADISVFRPSERVWYIQNSSNNSYNIRQFGLSDDLIVPADYDGDGKTDIAVFRPSNGVWYRLNSSNNNFSAVKFGTAGDVPAPADYDGDGKADLAVFRPSEGVWYRLFSSNNQFSAVAFGLSEDKPTVGDFDGDGKSDIAVWRLSNGVWYRLNSSDSSFTALQFGLPDDKPTAADFDGDGRTDIAVFRPSNGVWYYLKSGDGSFNSIAFGLSEDKPVAADYDGDGKADLAVFRPSNGVWYFLRSAQGFSAQGFGISGDLPSPNAFIR